MPEPLSSIDEHWMAIALTEAAKGQGLVEPNPLVGCVLVRDGNELARGYHAKFGEDHAESAALKNCIANGHNSTGSTAYVTLEPCCHQGKTPPCTDALINANVARVVVADGDPNPEVQGGGLFKLREAGIEVQVGVLCDEARRLNAPYLKRVETGKPWVIAKWAMTLDGKIATFKGDSKWISCEASRKIVHDIRRRVDAIIVGSGTVTCDDPLLTARPPGPRLLHRVVVDSRLNIDLNSQLVKTAKESPVILLAGEDVKESSVKALREAGCEVLQFGSKDRVPRINHMLKAFGERQMTNVLIEGGSALLGTFMDEQLVDEVHIFIGNRIVGGDEAFSPVAGKGVKFMANSYHLKHIEQQFVDGDVYIQGFIDRDDTSGRYAEFGQK